jgi:Glycosyltransferase family 87
MIGALSRMGRRCGETGPAGIDGRPIGIGDLAAAAKRVGSVVCFGLLPAILLVGIIAVTFGSATFSYDFHGGLYDGALAILHGHSPYRPAYLAFEAGLKRAGGRPPYIDVPVYPPPPLIATIPFTLLPYKAAGLVFAGLSIVALIATLRILEVRDWRCYGAALGSWPMIADVRLGGLTPLLALGAAVAWRSRQKALLPSASTATIISAKLFPWTIAFWYLVTRRLRTLALTVLFTALLILGSWALIDFQGMASYPHMLSNLSFIQQTLGISLVAGSASLGAPVSAGKIVAVALTGLVLLMAWRVAGSESGDRRAFGLVVMASLLGSTNVWPHYLVLVFVPIALISPTLSPLWLVPMLAYLRPVQQTHGDASIILPYLVIEALVIVTLCWPRPLRARARTRGPQFAATGPAIQPLPAITPPGPET